LFTQTESIDQHKEVIQGFLTQSINSRVSESQLPHKIVNLIFTIADLNNKFTIADLNNKLNPINDILREIRLGRSGERDSSGRSLLILLL